MLRAARAPRVSAEGRRGNLAGATEEGRVIFDVNIAHRDEVTVVLVRGEVDLATATHLDSALAKAQQTSARKIVVDLERVTFMDATGLEVLVRHATKPKADERLVLTPGPPVVQRLFELSGMRAELPFYGVR